MTTETGLMNYPQCKADSLVYDVIEHRPDISWDMSFGCQKDGFDESIFNFVIGFFLSRRIWSAETWYILITTSFKAKNIPFILNNVALLLGLIKNVSLFPDFLKLI